MIRSTSAKIAATLAFFALSPLPTFADDAHLHIGDAVTVFVFNHPELSGDRVVRSNGTISIPLAGSVRASGISTDRVADEIATRLHHYLPYAAVDIQLRSEGGAISVAGWPYGIPDGLLKYMPGETLASAIAAIRQTATPPTVGTGAQGAAAPIDPNHARIDLKSVAIVRDGARLGPYDAVALDAAGNPGPTLKPGDTIEFHNRPIAIVIQGAVRDPGVAYLNRDEQLSDALKQVGGTTDDASASDLTLVRNGVTQTITVADAAYHAPAQSGDRLTVGTAPQVLVTGIVLKPGTTQLKNDSTLLSAISNAGGPSFDSDLSHIKVIHDRRITQYDVTAVAHGDFSQNPELSDGDEIIVGRGHKVDPLVLAALIESFSYSILRF